QGKIPQFLLPLGISFFVFETIAYILDVYHGKVKPASRLSNYAMYLSFFPHLIAGPLYRYSEVAKYIERPLRMHRDAAVTGILLLSFGLWKKVFVANPLGELTDTIFSHTAPGSAEAWLGALSYTLQ